MPDAPFLAPFGRVASFIWHETEMPQLIANIQTVSWFAAECFARPKRADLCGEVLRCGETLTGSNHDRVKTGQVLSVSDNWDPGECKEASTGALLEDQKTG